MVILWILCVLFRFPFEGGKPLGNLKRRILAKLNNTQETQKRARFMVLELKGIVQEMGWNYFIFDHDLSRGVRISVTTYSSNMRELDYHAAVRIDGRKRVITVFLYEGSNADSGTFGWDEKLAIRSETFSWDGEKVVDALAFATEHLAKREKQIIEEVVV